MIHRIKHILGGMVHACVAMLKARCRGGSAATATFTRIKRWLKRLVVSGLVTAVVSLIALAIAWQVWPFPQGRLEAWPTSPVVTDARGGVMLQLVSADDQWCMPVELEDISPWLIQATIAVEDQRFRSHLGVDGVAVARAVCQNVSAGRRVSGASTLTMQICRMMDDRPRTLPSKCVESFRAVQLESLWSKDRILVAYLNMAPYGGNVRGVEAASRVYFGRRSADLSLAEAALLAGLPQSPARFRPDRHPRAAMRRRRTVLRRMLEQEMITVDQHDLATAEPVVTRRMERDDSTGGLHAAWLALRRRPDGAQTTIDPDIQRRVESLAVEHAGSLPDGTQVAVAVIDVKTSAIVAMVGSRNASDRREGQVNGVTARRSPGSALKPFIYAAAFEAGRLNAAETVYDVPICRAGWSPRNYDRTFRGPVSAGEALRKSLNIPAILIAEGVGLERCIGLMESAGISLPADARQRGGLGVVVGVIEVTLLDLTNAYATLGRSGRWCKPRLFVDEPIQSRRALKPNVCTAIDDVLSSRRRKPRGMERFSEDDVPWFMWKTGTSAGSRDAWAVGHNRKFAIGVWVGRFSGAGSVEYVGALAAEPLLANLFNLSSLRTNRSPNKPKPLIVRHRLPKPARAAAGPRIISPGQGDTFIALEGKSTIRPRANHQSPRDKSTMSWFINGRLLQPSQSQRLNLPPGNYELRCVNPTGKSSAVRFVVR